jgi:serine protease Do
MRMATLRSERRVGFAAVSALLCGMTLSARSADAQSATARIDALQQLNGSVESLVQRVAQSVVQVIATGYGPTEKGNGAETDLAVGRQRTVGSGIAIESDGYIVTNAHVIRNSRRIQIVLPGRGRTVDAAIVGVAPEIDLALLKAEDAHLPAIPMTDYDDVHQGELVFAFGSPQGLRNSVTMGIVSAVARQPDPDNPMVYVQTDAPINRGNSGGPLVNVKGELVGINTFILSDSGGSQGLGFAIPSALVQIAYPKLRRTGRLRRGEIGILLQAITPTLATGLGLSRDSGAMISDVSPASPADVAGLKVQDIVIGIDGEPIDGLPRLAFQLFTKSAGDQVTLDVLRGGETLTIAVRLAEPDKNRVARLGILGMDIGDTGGDVAAALRVPSGVMVVGRTSDEPDTVDMDLATGDTIHGVNGTPVTSIIDLRRALDGLKHRSAVALQIERNGQFIFLSFELD